MEISQDSRVVQQQTPVTVILGDDDGVRQPVDFHVCPLGLQFYSSRAIPEFELLEFRICIPGEAENTSESITCAGIVVHCTQEGNPPMYRIWVKFLDLPESKQQRIQCVAEKADFLCPYCENF